MNYINVNAHLHTPYSFSAFEHLTDALDRAVAEGVKVVGINDFNSMDGYVEWRDEALRRKLYPLFNIEFISLGEEDRAQGIRVNDPNNPGRIYLSGKGLKCPPALPEPYASQLAGVRRESNRQTETMCARLNETLAASGAAFRLDFERIRRELTRGAVRERHLARALRLEAFRCLHDDEAAISALLERLFSGKSLKSNISDHAAIENEIRGNLLKAGGTAFVPEEPKAFLPMESVCQIILAAGGIPAYPFLADDANGAFTDFEQDITLAAKTLIQRGIYSAEFIPTRNSIETLDRYAGYLHDLGFAVTFGSEHNTPVMEPVELFARGGVPLTARLKQINYEGACIIAAHQELVRIGKPGYVDAAGHADSAHRDIYIEMGNNAIQEAIY